MSLHDVGHLSTQVDMGVELRDFKRISNHSGETLLFRQLGPSRRSSGGPSMDCHMATSLGVVNISRLAPSALSSEGKMLYLVPISTHFLPVVFPNLIYALFRFLLVLDKFGRGRRYAQCQQQQYSQGGAELPTIKNFTNRVRQMTH